MHKFFSVALIGLVVASCQSSGDRQPAEPAPTTPTTFTPPPAPVPDSAKPGVLTNTATTTSGTATAALNPEHGAPGHRCDIPVGAPLNSPAGSAPAPTTNSAPMMINAQPPSSPANNNVRLNPAHGAPGHDCSIPVGQPLRS